MAGDVRHHHARISIENSDRRAVQIQLVYRIGFHLSDLRDRPGGVAVSHAPGVGGAAGHDRCDRLFVFRAESRTGCFVSTGFQRTDSIRSGRPRSHRASASRQAKRIR